MTVSIWKYLFGQQLQLLIYATEAASPSNSKSKSASKIRLIHLGYYLCNPLPRIIPRKRLVRQRAYCAPFIKSATIFDISNDLPPCTGGYSASVLRCAAISSPIGCINQETF